MKHPIVLFLVCIAGYLPVRAQQNMTLYQMHDIVQSNSLNPAIPALCKWTVGLPGLGSISLAAATPISYNDLGAGQPLLDTDKILSELKPTNVISSNNSINLLLIGYRSTSTYWQFTVNERISEFTSLPKDPLLVLLKGNAPFVGKEMSGVIALNAIHYREYALSVSHDFGNGLWAGIRPKLMFGRMGINGTNNKVSLYTDPVTYDLTLTSDLLIRAAVPGKPVFNPVHGNVSDFETDIKVQDLAFNSSNMGLGVDLGMSKQMESGWKLSASLLNIGRVSWTKNTHVFKQSATITYKGPTNSINNWDDLVDTLKAVTRLDYAQENYAQWLSPVAMFGASYPVAPKIRVGLTGMAEFQPSYTPWAITATAFTEGTSVVTAGLSYTLTPSSFVNLGVAAGLRLGAFNIHFLTDNIIAAFSPFSQRYTTLQMGIHFRFGCGNGGGETSDDIPCAAYRNAVVEIKDGVPCSKMDKKGKR